MLENSPNYGIPLPNKTDEETDVADSLKMGLEIIDTELKNRKDEIDEHKNAPTAHNSSNISHGDETVEVALAEVTATANNAVVTAEGVQEQFDRVVAEAGSNNPEVVQARGSEVNLNARLDKVDSSLAEKANKTYADSRGQFSDILTPVGYTRMIGHRGFSGVAPEGTLPAIILASELGLWSAEGDAQLTADGEWIVFHDSTVDRMTNGTGNVKDLTLAQIKALNIDSGNNIAYYPNLKIPTLKEFLLTCREYNIVPCIEIKSDTYEPTYTAAQYDSFINVIRQCGVENKIVVAGSEPLCTQIRNRSKSIVLMLFTSFASLGAWAGSYIQNSGNMILNTDNSYVTSKEDIELAHSMGIPVGVFVINDVNRAIELSKWGVDFITTDQLSGVNLKC